MDRVTIAVFGQSDAVTSQIVSSWSNAAINLVGPYAATACHIHDWEMAAALIDVRYSAEILLPLTEILEAKSIPYVFVVPVLACESEPGPFLLSGSPKDIDHIVAALAAQERGTTH